MKKKLLLILLIILNIIALISLSYISFKSYNYNQNINKEIKIQKNKLEKKKEEVNIIQEKINELKENNKEKITNYEEIESWIKELTEKM